MFQDGTGLEGALLRLLSFVLLNRSIVHHCAKISAVLEFCVFQMPEGDIEYGRANLKMKARTGPDTELQPLPLTRIQTQLATNPKPLDVDQQDKKFMMMSWESAVAGKIKMAHSQCRR